MVQKSACLGCVFLLLMASHLMAREWFDSTGTHKIDADMVSSLDGKVWLKKADGTVICVPLDRLSVLDREYVRSHPNGPDSPEQPPASGDSPRQTSQTPSSGPQPDTVPQLGPPLSPYVRVRVGNETRNGFIVDPSGVVVTNARILKSDQPATVYFKDRTSLQATGCLGMDVARNIAVLKIDSSRQLASLTLSSRLPRQKEVVRLNNIRGFVFDVLPAQQFIQFRSKGGDRFLAPDTVLIYTTLPSDDASWGLPVTDESGQVLGMLVRTGVEIPSPGFAIAGHYIESLVKACFRDTVAHLNAFDAADDLAELDSPNEPPRAVRPFPDVELPSGATLSFSAAQIPTRWFMRGVPFAGGLWPTNYPSGKPKSLHAFLNEEFHGPSLFLNEDGTRHWAAEYQAGDRNGSLWIWNRDRQLALHAQYASGRKRGVLCLFRDALPWMVQEWDKDRVTAGYLIKWNGAEPSLSARDQASDLDKAQFDAAEKYLAELEEGLRADESESQKDLARGLREISQANKRRR